MHTRLTILEHQVDDETHLDLLVHQGRRCPTFSLHPEYRSLHTGGSPQWSWFVNTPHRRFYMNYTGPVSGARGSVRCLWSGAADLTYQPHAHQRYVIGLGSAAGLRIILKTNGLACIETQSRLPRWLAKSSK